MSRDLERELAELVRALGPGAADDVRRILRDERERREREEWDRRLWDGLLRLGYPAPRRGRR